jgi:hypothetical protein
VAYAYGRCEIPENASGCQRPLEIQSWPACQRSLADYSFEGRPLPHEKLEKHDAAKVVEIDFAIENRVEVYTGETTVVIFATSPQLAREAVQLLRLRPKGAEITTRGSSLNNHADERLEKPESGSVDGTLACDL